LPGGYAICVRRKSIELDLPAGISRDEAVEFNNLCARADGVEGIESDGTLIYTEDARRTAKPFCAELAEPLSPKHWESRLVLRSFYEDCLRTGSGGKSRHHDESVVCLTRWASAGAE
jgi:hypothetical protein